MAQSGHCRGSGMGCWWVQQFHVVCDLTLASKEHAIFKQTDADVTSFDGGTAG